MRYLSIKLSSLALAVLALGCTAVQIGEPSRDPLATEDTMTFEASMAESGNDPGTKTGNLSDGRVYWSPGDEISVFSQPRDGGGDRFCSSATENEFTTTFTGTLSSGEATSFWAVYPYSTDNRFDGVNICTTLTDSQRSTAGTLSDGQWPTMAVSEGNRLDFYNICSGIRFTVAGAGIRSVTFRNIDGGKISGVMSVAWDGSGKPQVQEISGGTSEIVVTPAEGETFNVGSQYYVALPPVTMSRGLEVTYRKAGTQATYVNPASITFSRGRFKSLSGKDSGLVFTADGDAGYELVDGEPSDWSGRYILVDVSKAYVFTGETGTSNKYQLSSGDLSGEVITKDCSSYEFTVEKEGDSYFLIHNGQYLYCTYSSPGNSTTGLAYSNNRTHPLQLVQMSDGTFGFKSNSQCIYYKSSSGYFKFGGSYGSSCVYLYKYSKGLQNLSFAESSVCWVVGDTFQIGGSYPVQTLFGARTSVTYSSSNTDVATVSGDRITLRGSGTTTITASAAAADGYSSATASYTLVVVREGVFNLENSSVSSFFDDAAAQYTDDNWASVSVVERYCSNSSTDRKDVPAPVTVAWTTTPGSGNYVVSVYNDSALTDLETSATTSTAPLDICNLIPGRTYWYTVTKNDAQVASGSFSTEGRRRMLKISDTYAKGHANNCRDLGGLRTVDGRTLKYGLVFRGSNMDATTDEEKQYLTGYMNIKMDIDLRNSSTWGTPGKDGSSSAYKPFGSGWGVSYSNAGYNSFSDLTNTGKTRTTFNDIISTVTAGDACYVHCYVGADRTGYICMLLEAVLGVSAKDCSIDYELTSFSVVGVRTRTGTNDYYFRQGIQYINGYSGSTFKQKAENILLNAGITSEQITALREAMLD